jgi:putative transposase
MRFRLYPTQEQEIVLLSHCRHARFLWNLGLEQWRCYRKESGPTPGFAEQCRQLTEARAAEPWLAEGPVNIQQQALRDLAQACRNFYGGTHAPPTWRKKGTNEGFRVVGKDVHLRVINGKWGEASIPKLGWVRVRQSRTGWQAAKSYRVTRDTCGRWHIAFALIPATITAPGNGEVIGIDRGVMVSAALSTGELVRAPRLRPKEQERLLRLQRKLARCKRGSNRRAGIKRQTANLTTRAVDRRKDWVEKTSTDIARRFDVIRVERLDIKAMTKSATGTKEEPGTNVRQKAGLNRGILSSGWGALVRRLEDKAPYRVEKVRAAYTSQTCSVCGHRAMENRESQSVFRCRSCGYTGNADINAAINIAAGHAVTARGDSGLPGSVNRELQCVIGTSVGSD